MQTLLIVPAAEHVGLSSTCLGLLHSLADAGISAGYDKPFAAHNDAEDNAVAVVNRSLGLNTPQPMSQAQLERALSKQQLDDVLETIVARQQDSQRDVLIVEGLGFASRYADEINRKLANALDARVILLASAKLDSPEQLVQALEISARSFGGTRSSRVSGCILTHKSGDAPELDTVSIKAIRQHCPHFASESFRLLGVIPYLPDLSEPDARNLADALDIEALKACCAQADQPRLSPSAYRYQLVNKARAERKRIVLPEGSEPRTVAAACICQSRGIAQCVLLAKPEAVEAVAREQGLKLPEGLEILDPEPLRADYIEAMVARRRGKLSAAEAEQQLQDTVVMGTMMLHLDEVDGLVSGAVHTTANTVRPAFQLIKTAPAYSLVSSIFFMLLPEQVVVYGDCAINPEPSAEQLAEIAIQSAQSARAFGIEPRVAMISYSTGDSGIGAGVDKVREATRIARERAPELLIDGPLQYDAAAVASVGQQKAPDSKVAGQATVFIFPDLNTGNTTYKAVQRTAHVVSVGPMLQGLNKPVNDLSRGALVDDIVFTIALTVIQAAAE